MKLDLEQEWYDLASTYTQDEAIVKNTFASLLKSYTHKNRHYHNLVHIESMILAANQYKNELKDIDSFKFAIWFHDAIYDFSSSQNEARSAKLAINTLQEFEKINQNKIQKIEQYIIDTKEHKPSSQENDLLFFLDIDMQILGKNLEIYKEYSLNIRKEYQLVPKFLYKKGRKKVLKHFLERERIYFTDIFYRQFEQEARRNIGWEIESLS